REVERGDAGHHAQRLADRGDVDPGGDLGGQLALQLHADAAGQFDDLHAPGDLAEGVGVHLAVLGGDQLGDLVAVRVEQLAVLEQDRRAPGQRGGAPGGEGVLGGGDGGVDLVGGRERDLLLLDARGRVPDGAETAGGALDGLAADEMADGLHVLRRTFRETGGSTGGGGGRRPRARTARRPGRPPRGRPPRPPARPTTPRRGERWATGRSRRTRTSGGPRRGPRRARPAARPPSWPAAPPCRGWPRWPPGRRAA